MITKESLEEKKVTELRGMCRNMGIPGMSKKRKDVIIDAILKTVQNSAAEMAPKTKSEPTPIKSVVKDQKSVDETLKGVSGTFNTVYDRPDSRAGNRASTMISVSAGALSDKFPVVGKSVQRVMFLLREGLNLKETQSAVVNGENVPNDYILKEGDRLEFIKTAGGKAN